MTYRIQLTRVLADIDAARLSRWRAADRTPPYHLAGMFLLFVALLVMARKRWRFSIRMILIFTTLAAVLLGVLSFATKR